MTEEDIKEVVRLTMKEVLTQTSVDLENLNCFISTMNELFSTVKRNETNEKKKMVLEKSVRDAMIKRDYEKGLSYRTISDRYGMTLDGVYKKVKTMGIYKSRR